MKLAGVAVQKGRRWGAMSCMRLRELGMNIELFVLSASCLPAPKLAGGGKPNITISLRAL